MGKKRRSEQPLLPLAYLLNEDYNFAKSILGFILKKEIKMCESCGCTPGEEPIEAEVCSGCGKPTAECICEPEEEK
jgi:hypothetical protein